MSFKCPRHGIHSLPGPGFCSPSSFLCGFSLSFGSLWAFPEHTGDLFHIFVLFWKDIHQGEKTGSEQILMPGSSQESPDVWIRGCSWVSGMRLTFATPWLSHSTWLILRPRKQHMLPSIHCHPSLNPVNLELLLPLPLKEGRGQCCGVHPSSRGKGRGNTVATEMLKALVTVSLSL